MLVYLNDVTLGGGPFEYIPRSLGVGYRHVAGIERELNNERMSQVVPVEQWRRVYGAAGTIVLADTAQIFHHESLQTERDRSVIMIGYSSRRPRSMGTAMAHFPVEEVADALEQIIPAPAYPYVFGWRRAIYAPKPVAIRAQGAA
jgi:hypothetical protein